MTNFSRVFENLTSWRLNSCTFLAASFVLGTTAGATSGTPNYSGYLVVASATTDSGTGPGFLTVFNSKGTFHKVLRDYFAAGAERASGTAFVPPNQIVAAVESSAFDRLEEFTLDEPSIITNHGVGILSGTPLRQLARNSNGDFYVVENNGANSTIEKFNSNFVRSGGPFIGVGSTCSLNAASPYGIAYIPGIDRLAVTGAGGRLNLYDNATGNCVSSITTGIFTASNAPSGIVYHPTYNRLLVVLSAGNAIHSCAIDGSSCVAIYSSAEVLNSPRAIALGPDGSIYVSSSGNDNILRFTWTGAGRLVLIENPFIPVGAYTQNIQSIVVIP